ncbi:MAG TPA: phosphatase PAP2 family protein [Bacteroidota bacterium]|nr:phosphatase PAP2 family protein [Bacteroidota bacterium]
MYIKRKAMIKHNDSNKIPFAIDLLCVSFLGGLILIGILLPERLIGGVDLTARIGIAFLAHVAAVWMLRPVEEGHLHATLRVGTLAVLFFFLFDQMQYFQHVFFSSWFDADLVRFEQRLIGTQVIILLEDFVHPIITEGMMFAYVAYYPMLLGFAFLCHASGGNVALHDYLINLLLTLVVCYTGFLLLPIAGPLYFNAGMYSVPLEGGLFTWCGEWIRNNQHYPGGSLPSAHCAAATVMLVMLHRYNKAAFYIALPTIAILCMATVYGRYHYIWDSIAGILTALSIVRCSSSFVRFATSLRVTIRTLTLFARTTHRTKI